MVQGFDPNNPNPQQGQPGLPPGADGALGFQAAPKQEKYNTQYLTANLGRQQRNMRLLIVGVLAAAGLGIVFWMMISGGEKKHIPPPPGMEAADIEPEAPKPTAEDAPKAAE